MEEVELPETWEAVEGADCFAELRQSWERELLREIGPMHCLYGQKVLLIGRRSGSDDAIFRLADGRVAEVHLTWTGRQETHAIWPAAAIFSSLAEWIEARQT
ncbi:hypothetical protein [Tabrizicola sp.]|uniref:hypothetical protein n=1 Tax=Tabrizicola sp. TaxID=2005166 RepID=UPI003F3E64CD